MLENSALIGVLDMRYHFYNPRPIRKKIHFRTEKWEEETVENYLETIDLSNKVTKTFKSNLFGNTQFIAIFQPINAKKEYVQPVRFRMNKMLSDKDYAYDFYNKFDNLPLDVWYDVCHVKDEGNQYMAQEIANLLIEKYLKKYKK